MKPQEARTARGVAGRALPCWGPGLPCESEGPLTRRVSSHVGGMAGRTELHCHVGGVARRFTIRVDDPRGLPLVGQTRGYMSSTRPIVPSDVVPATFVPTNVLPATFVQTNLLPATFVLTHTLQATFVQ